MLADAFLQMKILGRRRPALSKAQVGLSAVMQAVVGPQSQ